MNRLTDTLDGGKGYAVSGIITSADCPWHRRWWAHSVPKVSAPNDNEKNRRTTSLPSYRDGRITVPDSLLDGDLQWSAPERMWAIYAVVNQNCRDLGRAGSGRQKCQRIGVRSKSQTTVLEQDRSARQSARRSLPGQWSRGCFGESLTVS